MRSVPRMTWQLTFSRVQPARPNGLSGLNFGCLRHDCFQKCFIYGLNQIPSRKTAMEIMNEPYDDSVLCLS